MAAVATCTTALQKRGTTMDLLANILSAVLVCGVIGAGIAIAWRIGRADLTTGHEKAQ